MTSQAGSVSGHVRSHQRLVPTMFMTRHIVGEDRECRLGGYFWKRFGEEVCRSQAGLHRAERMIRPSRDAGAWACELASRRCCTASSRCSCSHLESAALGRLKFGIKDDLKRSWARKTLQINHAVQVSPSLVFKPSHMWSMISANVPIVT